MNYNEKKQTLKILVICAIAFVYITPIVMMVLGSLKVAAEAVRFDLSLPSKFMWENYAYVFEKGNIFTGYYNSIIMTVSSNMIVLMFGTLAGIYVGRRKNKLSGAIYNYFVIGLTLT